jgi:deoxycytidylate deaminase
VIVYKKQILSVGYNQEKTHTLQAIYNQYREFHKYNHCAKIHAEIDAISKIRHLDIDWGKVEIYIYRERKDTNERALAYPCKACRKLLENMGIKHIYYTGENSYCFEYVS